MLEKISTKQRLQKEASTREYVLSDTSDTELKDAGITKETYEQFLKAFYDTAYNFKKILKEKYAKKPETFPEDLFDIVPMITAGQRLSLEYMRTDAPPMGQDPDTWMNIDAPFSYSMRFKNEQISVVSFRLDFKRKLIIIDQLQGGTTDDMNHQTNLPARARNKIGIANLGPEGVLYDAAAELAKSIGMRGVALRKWEHNIWRYKDGEEFQNTLYEKIAKANNHIIFKKPAHTFKSFQVQK